ncbi:MULTISPECIES: hypothetical protein [Acidaminococcus]|jgi:hypothetical protein|uniref:Uncharacterized protein n=1 Tax=Siphoviridae sp. ctm7X10 TaxID=2827929 RepID=A0A8S5S5L4_9CAUD|nr:hypothetical protein [Acidaminococcus massiliensis]DAF46099.1 MAG TPA: hypothetical protein [Siphoviridae sp. ctm7X10]
MIIAKGNVHTAEGPVPVEKLETGMLVVDRGHRARKLLKVEQVQLHQTLHFEKNPELVLAGNSVLFTLTGLRSAITLKNVRKAMNGRIQMLFQTSRVQDDVMKVKKEEVTGYRLTIEGGRDVLVNGYDVADREVE